MSVSRFFPRKPTFSAPIPSTPALSVLIGLFAAIITRRAWVGDDAYITFRTVDNFIHGYGLTWNVGERVQAYTHPLWMFLLSAAYFVTHEIYFTSLAVSILISLAAVVVLARSARSLTGALVAVLALALSNAFVDYSTSGLENPLTHLLLAGFFALYFGLPASRLRLFWLAVLAALGGVNRMDTLLLFGPALLLAAWELPGRKIDALPPLLAGVLPFLLWEAFSLVYYGFPFPNTAYAKLNTGVESRALIEQGLFYFSYSLQYDPLTLLAIAAGLAVAMIGRRPRALAVLLGVLLYLAYTVKIGGDFMSGRFFTAPLLCALALVGQAELPRFESAAGATLLAVTLLAGLIAPLPTYRIDRPESYSVSDARRINDERAWYFPDVSLMSRSRSQPYPTSQGRQSGLAARALGEQDYTVLPAKNIGLMGYYAGPRVYLIDEYALADPLLARLPAEREANIYVGHFHRRAPDGYLSTIYTGKNQLTDENLARFYDQLRLIVRGPLFSAQRWQAIWRLNTGQLNALIDTERYRFPDRQQITLEQAGQKAVTFTDSGVLLNLEGAPAPARLQLTLDSASDFLVIYRLEGREVGRQTLTAAYGPQAASLYTLRAPLVPYDTLWVLPLGELKEYHLSGVQILP